MLIFSFILMLIMMSLFLFLIPMFIFASFCFVVYGGQVFDFDFVSDVASEFDFE